MGVKMSFGGGEGKGNQRKGAKMQGESLWLKMGPPVLPCPPPSRPIRQQVPVLKAGR